MLQAARERYKVILMRCIDVSYKWQWLWSFNHPRVTVCPNLSYEVRMFITATSNDRHDVLNYFLIECLFNCLFRLTTKTFQRSALLSLCESKPPVTNRPIACFEDKDWIKMWVNWRVVPLSLESGIQSVKYNENSSALKYPYLSGTHFTTWENTHYITELN